MRLELYNEFSFTKAYVVFQDETSLRYLKLLKKGFRHCYLLFNIEQNKWLELNPMSNQIHLVIRDYPKDYNFISNLQKHKIVCGLPVKEAELKPSPVGFFTCVEFTKRVIGMHDFFTITPYQLYKKIYNLQSY